MHIHLILQILFGGVAALSVAWMSVGTFLIMLGGRAPRFWEACQIYIFPILITLLTGYYAFR